MPDGDGTQLIKEFRAKNPRLITHVISGYGERKAEVLALGAQVFWLKPLDYRQIQEAIVKIMEEKV